ncbi:MAG: DUF4258 domain-containing protein [Candidatus Omnitrophica bacterium]|nr:DUF4258 domain-containing protein [Candidatus Omnitrophota bacterium]
MIEITFSSHALIQMKERGASADEVREAILKGEKTPAKKGRDAYRLNFQYDKIWGERHYALKQVMPVVKEESGRLIVITVYVFYFWEVL